jgi:hypothetical protein
MKLCYFDESGDSSQPTSLSPPSNIQPLFIVLGLFIDATHLHALTKRFIDLKYRFHPRLFQQGDRYLRRLMTEVKGSNIRADFRKANKGTWKSHLQFLSELLKLLDSLDAKIVSRAVIKSPDVPFNGNKVYTSAVQDICRHFNRFLVDLKGQGLVIADHRTPGDDKTVAFSIGTQKFRTLGDPYERIVECPTFACSDVHAGIQIADLVVSTVINPIAAYTYCLGQYSSVHVSKNYFEIKRRLAPLIKQLRFGYQDDGGKWRGGITINDRLGKKSSSEFFK